MAAVGAALAIGAGALYLYNHLNQQQNSSSADSSDGEEEAPRAKKNPAAERGLGDNGGPPLNEPGALPPDDPRRPAVAPLVPIKDKSGETPAKEGEESSLPKDNTSNPKPVEGALPNAENAIVDPRKIYDYSLNPEHAKGGPKAALLDQTLGFNRSNGEGLIEQIQRGVIENPVVDQTETEYGTRFDVDIPVTGPNGNTETIRTGWTLRRGESTPRLTTAFVRRRSRFSKLVIVYDETHAFNNSRRPLRSL